MSSNSTNTSHLMSRIDNLEKSLLEIHYSIASYAIKIAKTRDMADILSTNVLKCGENETIETSLRQGLTKFADCLTLIQDFRDDQVKHIEEKVINELSIYGELTKLAKDELKQKTVLKDKESLMIKSLSQSNSLNEMPNAITAYELQLQRFEMRKICDIKRIFLELTKSELLFHSKTIEVLTKAYKHLLSINADSDLQEFCTFFKMTNLGSPKRQDPIDSLNDESNESISTLRRFNSVPTLGSNIINDEKSNQNKSDSKSIESFVESLRN